MSVTRRLRVPIAAATCMLVLTLAVLLTAARGWAIARTESHCGQVVAAAPAPGTVAGKAAPLRAPATHRVAYAPARSWRSHALRAVGCGAWYGMHHRTHQKHRA